MIVETRLIASLQSLRQSHKNEKRSKKTVIPNRGLE